MKASWRTSDMQPPIQDYALIGDCRSAALVSRGGSLDWLCWPHFDSPAVFGSLLDAERGGAFAVGPSRPARIERRYRPETNLLETTFRGATGSVRLTDLMPVWGAGGMERLHPEHEILRLVECLGGEMELEVRYDPRPGFGRARLAHRDRGVLGHRLRAGKGVLILRTDCELAPDPRGGLSARMRLRRGEARSLSLTYCEEGPAVLSPLGAYGRAVADWTANLWREWARRACCAGPWRSAVVRSALALKLLSFSPSGAIVAAPTSSLPERLGGDLNWDYRFCWLRDASLTARALFGLGYVEEARAFVSWLLHATRLTRPTLRVLYDVYGRHPGGERDLEVWSGYRGSRPVRLGNGARDQLQLDVYGEVIDAATQFARRGGRLDRETSAALIAFGDYVVKHWREPDEGIWEVRSGRRAHTHSRTLCWAALDRLVELSDRGQLAGAPAARYLRARSEIRRAIEAESFDPSLGSYLAAPGDTRADATLLLLPVYGYCPADSPRMRRTYERVLRELGAGGGLLYRYRRGEDSAGEGAFGVCSFWAVQHLADGGGSLSEAEELFSQMLERASDLGLYAEEVDPRTGDALGNFPQAFTHIGVINAALALEAREARERGEVREAPAAAEELAGGKAHL